MLRQRLVLVKGLYRRGACTQRGGGLYLLAAQEQRLKTRGADRTALHAVGQ